MQLFTEYRFKKRIVVLYSPSQPSQTQAAPAQT